MTNEQWRKLRPTKQALFRALVDEMEAVRASVVPQLPVDADPDVVKVVVLDNLLRFCMEVGLDCSLPHGPLVNAELAGRLCSLAISAADPAAQPAIVATVAANLPAMHAQRVARGSVITATWEQENKPN